MDSIAPCASFCQRNSRHDLDHCPLPTNITAVNQSTTLVYLHRDVSLAETLNYFLSSVLIDLRERPVYLHRDVAIGT